MKIEWENSQTLYIIIKQRVNSTPYQSVQYGRIGRIVVKKKRYKSIIHIQLST